MPESPRAHRTSIMAPRRKTVEECGMKRTPTTFNSDLVEFMAPSLAVPGNWRAYEIRGSTRSGCENTQFNHYAVNIEAGAYCTLSLKAQEEYDATGVTKMDYHDMILDNYAAAGGDPAEIKVLGTRNVLNGSARIAIEDTFKSAQQDPMKPDSIRLDASEASYNACAILQPFEKDHSCLVNNCGQHLGFAEPSAFIAFIEKPGEPGDNTESQTYHLIALLGRTEESDTETSKNTEKKEARKAAIRNAIALIDDAIVPLEGAKDDAEGDQRIRDSIKILDEAIRQLRS